MAFSVWNFAVTPMLGVNSTWFVSIPHASWGNPCTANVSGRELIIKSLTAVYVVWDWSKKWDWKILLHSILLFFDKKVSRFGPEGRRKSSRESQGKVTYLFTIIFFRSEIIKDIKPNRKPYKWGKIGLLKLPRQRKFKLVSLLEILVSTLCTYTTTF